MTGSAHIIRANALRIPLAAGSVHLALSSPPYFCLRDYRSGDESLEGQIGSEATPEEFLRALWAVSDEVWRVLTDDGSWFVNLGEKYSQSGGHNNAGISSKSTLSGNGHVGGVGKTGPNKIKATRRQAPDAYVKNPDWARPKSLMCLPDAFKLGMINPAMYRNFIDPPQPGKPHPQWILRARVKPDDEFAEHVWLHVNGLPESVQDRVRNDIEYIYHFTKQEHYFAAVDEIREPHAPWTLKAYEYEKAGYNRKDNADRVDRGGFAKPPEANPLGKLPGSVWRIASEPLKLPTWRVVRAGRTVQWFLPRPAPKARKSDNPGFFDPDPNGRIATLRRRLKVKRGEEEQLVVNEAGQLVPRPGGRDMAYEDALKWMRAMGLSGGRPSLRRVTSHFAAFPTELPRRIILGFSPSAICTACGEGRRPVVGKEAKAHWKGGSIGTSHLQGDISGMRMGDGAGRFNYEATILGYACACPEPTAPTRPAIILDPFVGTGTSCLVAKTLGRTGIGVDLSHSYCKVAEWRCASGQGAKAEARTWASAQGSLL